MASFGAGKLSECRWKPGGFTRLTPEVMNWVNNVTGTYHVDIKDQGEMIIVQHFFLTNHIISAVLITGGYRTGQSAEIYYPDKDSPCVLPNIQDSRYDHTQDDTLMCGGRNTHRYCRRWNADTGAWDLLTESFTEPRYYHTSWTPADGAVTYLMGGSQSETTSNILQHENNKVSKSFPLKHETV